MKALFNMTVNILFIIKGDHPSAHSGFNNECTALVSTLATVLTFLV